jgi:hypothetical protein
MIDVCRYENTDKTAWNEFIRNSKRHVPFERDYMDYHADRFADCSLMFRDESGKLVAVLPANLKDKTLFRMAV